MSTTEVRTVFSDALSISGSSDSDSDFESIDQFDYWNDLDLDMYETTEMRWCRLIQQYPRMDYHQFASVLAAIEKSKSDQKWLMRNSSYLRITALGAVIAGGIYSISDLQRMVKMGAPLDSHLDTALYKAIDCGHGTPLFQAVQQGPEARHVVNWLILRGADYMFEDSSGYNILHSSCRMQCSPIASVCHRMIDIDLVQWLLSLKVPYKAVHEKTLHECLEERLKFMKGDLTETRKKIAELETLKPLIKDDVSDKLERAKCKKEQLKRVIKNLKQVSRYLRITKWNIIKYEV